MMARRRASLPLLGELDAAVLEHLEAPMQLAAWDDIGIVERFLCLLREVDGDGSKHYLRRQGAKATEHLLRAGFYQHSSTSAACR